MPLGGRPLRSSVSKLGAHAFGEQRISSTATAPRTASTLRTQELRYRSSGTRKQIRRPGRRIERAQWAIITVARGDWDSRRFPQTDGAGRTAAGRGSGDEPLPFLVGLMHQRELKMNLEEHSASKLAAEICGSIQVACLVQDKVAERKKPVATTGKNVERRVGPATFRRMC